MNKLLTLLFICCTATLLAQIKEHIDFTKFLPAGYVIYETIEGDVNQDGIDDCVLIVKASNKDNIVLNRFDEMVDRNRRGILVLLNKNNQYEVVVKNYTCFESEHEDGGVYYPPQLSVAIKNNKLYIHYEHGRYGYWQYTFGFHHDDFELIGYDHTQGGVVTEKISSINFLTKKKQEKVNVNENADGGDEVFKETWKTIEIDHLIRLSAIEDFYALDMHKY